jgi:hypothetical protein
MGKTAVFCPKNGQNSPKKAKNFKFLDKQKRVTTYAITHFKIKF